MLQTIWDFTFDLVYRPVSTILWIVGFHKSLNFVKWWDRNGVSAPSLVNQAVWSAIIDTFGEGVYDELGLLD